MWRRPLVKKNKARARAWLYGSGIGVVLAACALLVVARSARPVRIDVSWQRPVSEYEAMPEIALLQDYIHIDTSASGSEVPGAQFLARALAAAGIDAHIERIGARHANLWAVIEGEDPRALVLHSHIDVDPIARPESWNHDPFGAVILPPWLIGRGAFDMKSVAIAQLMAMRALAESGRQPRRSVVFLATGDEETGSRFGLSWFMRAHPELVARFETALTEGGVVEAVTTDRVKYWGLEFAQKRYIKVEACHASRARLQAMYSDLKNLDRASLRRFLSPQVRRFLAVYGPTREQPEFARRLADPEGLLTDARFAELPLYLQLMVRGDVVPLTLEKDPESSGFRLSILVAIMPGDDLDRALAEMLPAWITHGVALHIDTSAPEAVESPLDQHDAKAILSFMRRDVPNTVHGPMVIPTARTDARILRHYGIAAYGFSPFLILSTDTLQMKGPNERMALPAYIDGVRRYVDLVRTLVLNQKPVARDPGN